MNMEKLKEIFSDVAFVKSLFAMETVAEVQAALQEKGAELSEEEILSIRELLAKAENGEISQEQLASWQQQAADGELSDEVLEKIAGGSITVCLVAMAAVAAVAVGGYIVGEVYKARW